jgi:hypothetical protein
MRSMVGAPLAKSVYALPKWSRTLRMVAEHDALQAVLGGVVLSDDATVRAVKAAVPGSGVDVAIDGSDLPA